MPLQDEIDSFLNWLLWRKESLPMTFLAVPSAPTMVVVIPLGSSSYSCILVSLRRLLPRPLRKLDILAPMMRGYRYWSEYDGDLSASSPIIYWKFLRLKGDFFTQIFFFSNERRRRLNTSSIPAIR